jgi:GT2 family glycosyltransferase
MSVTVVIGNYNGEHLLGECLASLAEQTLRPDSILVVDGASADASRAVAEAAGATFMPRENRGLGYLYNEGVAASKSEFVFVANNDIAAHPTCLEHLASAMHEGTTFCADARQLDWGGSRTIHARTTLTRGRMTREYLPGLHLDDNVPAAGIAPTVCGNGAAMLVRTTMMRSLGGFDETFFMEWEDLDLCWRAWLKGWGSVYVPAAVVRHRVGAVTTKREQPRRTGSSHHNLLRFALKCLPAVTAAKVVLGELLRLPRHPRPVVTGLAAVARELPAIVRLRAELRPNRDLLRRVLDARL